jgi:hypothetical protein
MAYFTRGDLQLTGYDWKAKEEHDDAHIRGFPDNALLARNEGYEVVSFINTVGRWSNWTSKAGGHKIERMLKSLPGDIRSRKNVLAWIRENWTRFS